LAAGHGNRQIATDLKIAKSTVINHRCSLYRKIGATCIAQAAIAAVRHKVVEV
jgi:DNA-binding NarL/FixJ family response regulator